HQRDAQESSQERREDHVKSLNPFAFVRHGGLPHWRKCVESQIVSRTSPAGQVCPAPLMHRRVVYGLRTKSVMLTWFGPAPGRSPTRVMVPSTTSPSADRTVTTVLPPTAARVTRAPNVAAVIPRAVRSSLS